MSGKSIRIISNARSKWMHIPISVGGNAPKRNDLIEFEELDVYDTEIMNFQERSCKVKSETPRKKSAAELTKKRSRDKTQDKHSLPLCQANDKQKIRIKKESVSRKRKMQKATKLKSKKQKVLNVVDLQCQSPDILDSKMSQWNSFGISTLVLKGMQDVGFFSPMPIQSKVMHAAISEKRDILGAAETGSGKTLAFGIPLLHHLIKDKTKPQNATEPDVDKIPSNVSFQHVDNDPSQSVKKKFLPALILTPTRELALQVMKHLKNVAKHCGIWIMAVVGGMAAQKQIRLLNKGPDIVVATPGRMWELMNEEIVYLSHIHLLRYLVIDEADRMLEQGHFKDLTKLLDLINNKDSLKTRQTFIFSATLTTTHVAPHRSRQLSGYQSVTKEIKLSKLMKKIGIRSKPHVVDLTTKKVVAEALQEGKIICEYTNKDFYLYYFLKSFPGRTLVFANSIDCVFRLTALFELLGCKPLHIHSKMQQRQRLKHLERFQDQPNAVMLASDVAARGLDIPNVRHVIHYQTPRTMETYVHRSGRCARSGKEGYALMLISPQELNLYKKLCKNLDRDDGIADFLVENDYMSAIKNRVIVARELDRIIHQQKKSDVDSTWFTKHADAVGVELDENIVKKRSKDEQVVILRQRKHLKTLLSTPIFPSNFSGKFLTKQGKLTLPGIEQNQDKNKQRK